MISDRKYGTRYRAVLALALILGMLGPAATTVAQDIRKDYALIFGTVWSADRRPVYGVTVKIRRAEEKKARWELMSNHTGEFAQRVPKGKADYVVWTEVKHGKQKTKTEATVHVENDERVDVSLHLTE